jgi:hypothetical protein
MKYRIKTKKRKQKNNITHKKFIKKLVDLYPKCKHDESSNNIFYDGHKITYGEMEYDGIQQLYSTILNKYNKKIDCFMDIGSGRGKLCMYMAAQPKTKKVLGIELVEQRHRDASILQQQLKSEYADKVMLLNNDIFNINLSNYSGNNVFVWFSNLCFDQDITNKIFEKLNDELPKGSIISCSKQPKESSLIFLESITIPMSWTSNSNVYIYRT